MTAEDSAFKRAGRAADGAPHVRIFESIGGLGESVLLRTGEIEGDGFADMPLLIAARQVLGVMYELA